MIVSCLFLYPINDGNIHNVWSCSEDAKSSTSVVPATQSLQFVTGFCEKPMTGSSESIMNRALLHSSFRCMER